MGRFSVIELPYIHTYKDKTGTLRRYYRRHGKQTPLPGAVGSREFMDAYAAASANQPAPAKKRPSVVEKSFAAIATLYYGSSKYQGLAESSRANYRRVIDRFLEKHGHRRVDQIIIDDIEKIIGEMAGKPGAAIVLLKRIRTLLRYAVKLKWIPADPSAGAESYRSKEFHTWTEEEIQTFETHWPARSRERLAFGLLLFTGQRGSDVRNMTWADIAGDTIHVAQIKTKQENQDERLYIPLHPDLSRILAVAKRKHASILTTAYAEAFSLKGFGNMISDAIRAAGLPTKCKAHGLRKAAARRLAEAGCSANQIAAVTGHKTLAEIERYTRKADQKRLARQAIEKQAGNVEWLTRPKAVANQSQNE